LQFHDITPHYATAGEPLAIAAAQQCDLLIVGRDHATLPPLRDRQQLPLLIC